MPAISISTINTVASGIDIPRFKISSKMLGSSSESAGRFLMSCKVWLMYFTAVLKINDQIVFFIQLFNFLKNCLDSVKKSCAWNNFFIVGVIKNRHKNVTVISFKAVNEMLVASIIFCASESGARSGSKQPRRVLKLRTATATEFRNKNNFYIFYWILKLKFTFQGPAVHFIDKILVHFVVQFPD